jgi:hypothetical protein
MSIHPLAKSSFHRSQDITRRVLHTAICKNSILRPFAKIIVPLHATVSTDLIRSANVPYSAIKVIHETAKGILSSQGERANHFKQAVEYGLGSSIDAVCLSLPLLMQYIPDTASTAFQAEVFSYMQWIPAAIYIANIGFNYWASLTTHFEFYDLAEDIRKICKEALEEEKKSFDAGIKKLSFVKFLSATMIAEAIQSYQENIPPEKVQEIKNAIAELKIQNKESYLLQDPQKLLSPNANDESKALLRNLQKAAQEIQNP